MNQARIAANLAAVDAHFHAEAENEVAAALELYTDDIVRVQFERGGHLILGLGVKVSVDRGEVRGNTCLVHDRLLSRSRPVILSPIDRNRASTNAGGGCES